MPQDCLLDFTISSTASGTQASDYMVGTPLTITPSTDAVVMGRSMTIALGFGYPTCTAAQLSNGPSATPCAYDPEIMDSHWLPPGSTSTYSYLIGQSFNACGQNSQGVLPTGVTSITCQGDFPIPAGTKPLLDPNSWFIVEAQAQVDSSDPTQNGTEFAEIAVTLTEAGPPVLPSPVSVTFTAGSSALSASARSALTSLSKRLQSGASLAIVGYARSDALALSRARTVELFIGHLVSVHVTLKAVTTASVNRVTVTTDIL